MFASVCLWAGQPERLGLCSQDASLHSQLVPLGATSPAGGLIIGFGDRLSPPFIPEGQKGAIGLVTRLNQAGNPSGTPHFPQIHQFHSMAFIYLIHREPLHCGESLFSVQIAVDWK